jgi:hypothetical protein
MAFSYAVAAFRNLVLYGIRVGAKKEVMRAHAEWDITAMKHIYAMGDGSVVQLPRETVREKHFVAAFARCNIAIPVSVRLTSPEPPCVGFGNTLPESLGDGTLRPHRSRSFGVRPQAVHAALGHAVYLHCTVRGGSDIAFTYDPTDAVFLATDLGRVRRRVGDTIAAEATWTDEEILDALAETGSVAGAVGALLATVPGEDARSMRASVAYASYPVTATMVEAPDDDAEFG